MCLLAPMVISNGARLAFWLCRRTPHHASFRNESWSRAGYFAPVFGYQNSSKIACNRVATRMFHSTGSKCMAARHYYDILGISKNASSSEIKKAYLALAKKLHPDINKDDTNAGRKFQEVQKAYEVLKDKERYLVYDQQFWKIFDQRHGGQYFKIPIEFMLAVTGGKHSAPFVMDLPCEDCGGTGIPPGTRSRSCELCRGSGLMLAWNDAFSLRCIACDGIGLANESLCRSCDGKRVVMKLKIIEMTIRPGIETNEIIKVSRSGAAGYLKFIVEVENHSVFSRQGLDIHVDVNLSVNQAILGGTISVPTITGDVILKVRPGTLPGQKVVLKRKGIMIPSKGYIQFGDQYVHFTSWIPCYFFTLIVEMVKRVFNITRLEPKYRVPPSVFTK